MKKIALSLLLGLFALPAFAVDTIITDPHPATDTIVTDVTQVASTSPEGHTAAGIKIGTLGAGIEITHAYTDSFGARVAFNTFAISKVTTSGQVTYNAKLDLQTVEALADWYPWQGSFRTTGGLVYNNNNFALNAAPSGGTYTINNQTFTSAQVGSLNAAVTFNKVAPYLGFGWGNPAATGKGWGVDTDFGIMYQGRPNATLSATSSNPLVQSAVAADQSTLQAKMNSFRFYPVASLAITYKW